MLAAGMGFGTLGRSMLPPHDRQPRVSSSLGSTENSSSAAQTEAQLRAAQAAASLALEAISRGAVADGSLQDVFAALATAFATAGTPYATTAAPPVAAPPSKSAADPSAASGPAAAGSGNASNASPRLPGCAADFQAMSAVLKAFLGAAQAPALVLEPTERQSSRVAMVRGQNGSLAARAPSGANIRLSWEFAPNFDSTFPAEKADKFSTS